MNMKKLFGVFFMILCIGSVMLFSVDAFAAESKNESAQTGVQAEIADTGVSPANLGTSFYARISLEDPDKYLTIPADVMHTAQLKEYVNDSTQIWHFTRQIDGSYKVRNVSANLYMELYDDDPRENDEVFFTDSDNLPDQRWILQKAGNGYQFYTPCNTSFLLKGVNLYGHNAELIISQDSFRESTHFIITKLPFTSDYLSTPQVKLSNVYGGVSITWNKVPYAVSYRVYRYNDATKKWVTIKNTTDTTYVDKSVASGVTYKYTVKCITPMLSKFNSYSIKYVAAPTVKVSNSNSGVTVSWNKVAGAEAYRVFFKSTGSWKTMANVKTNSYTFKAPYNVTYTYTVRCMTADFKRFTSAYDTVGVTNKIVQTPKFSVKMEPNGFRVNWNNVPGAYRYKLFVKSKATNWKWSKSYFCVGNSHFYSGAIDNEAYYFAVRCIDEKFNYTSGFNSSAKLIYYSAPRVSTLTANSSKVRLGWNKVAGAAKYRVFSWNGQKWVKRLDTTALTVNLAVSGTAEQNACFAVRCLNKNGRYISNYFEAVVEGGAIMHYSPGGYTGSHKF